MPEANKIKKEDEKVDIDTSGPEVDVVVPEEKAEEVVETKEQETVKEVETKKESSETKKLTYKLEYELMIDSQYSLVLLVVSVSSILM